VTLPSTADIDHAQLAALQERVAGGRGRLGLVGQLDAVVATATPPITKRSAWL
jgi:hypothetical protein